MAPPVTETVINPSVSPKQLILPESTTAISGAEILLTEVLNSTTQLFSSVTVRVYMPAFRFTMLSTVTLLLHNKSYVPTPPVISAYIAPLAVLQFAANTVKLTTIDGGCRILST